MILRPIGLPRYIEEFPYFKYYIGKRFWYVQPSIKGSKDNLLQLESFSSDNKFILRYKSSENIHEWVKERFTSKAMILGQYDNKSKMTIPLFLDGEFPKLTETGYSLIYPFMFSMSAFSNKSNNIYSLEGRVPGLARWLEKENSFFKNNFSDLLDKKFKQIIEDITYIDNLGVIYFNNFKFTVQLKVGLTKDLHTNTNNKVLGLESSIRLDFADAVEPSQAVDIFRILENLFNFIFLKKHYCDIFIAFTKSNYLLNQPYFDRNKKYPDAIYIFNNFMAQKHIREEYFHNKTLFSYKNLNLYNLVKRWFELYVDISDSAEHLVDSYNMGINAKFLQYVRIIEMTFNRYYLNPKYIKQEDDNSNYERQKHTLLEYVKKNDSFGDNFERIIKSKMKYNNLQLIDILRRIFKSINYDICREGGGIYFKNNEEMIGLIVGIRNYLTHGKRKSTDKDINKEDIFKTIIPLNYAAVIPFEQILQIGIKLDPFIYNSISENNVKMKFL